MKTFLAVFGSEPRPRDVVVMVDGGLCLQAGDIQLRDINPELAAKAILEAGLGCSAHPDRIRRLLAAMNGVG